MNITKILLSIIIGVAVATSADAANTMCVTSDNNSIILDPSIQGTGHSDTPGELTWTTTFPNYTISGIARCTDNDWGYTWGKTATAKSGIIDNYPTDRESIEENNYTHCWCRMTYPVRASWVYYAVFTMGGGTCLNRCAYYCGQEMSDAYTWRSSVFATLGM